MKDNIHHYTNSTKKPPTVFLQQSNLNKYFITLLQTHHKIIYLMIISYYDKQFK